MSCNQPEGFGKWQIEKIETLPVELSGGWGATEESLEPKVGLEANHMLEQSRGLQTAACRPNMTLFLPLSVPFGTIPSTDMRYYTFH